MNPRILLSCLFIVAIGAGGCSSSPEARDAWTGVGGPYAREVSAVAPDPSRSGIVYAALSTGDIYRSEDSGGKWLFLSSLGSQVHPYRFVVTPDTPLVTALLTDAGLFIASANKHQWKAASIGTLPPGTGAHAIAFDPWKPSTWYVGTDGHGIYRSTNSGQTWNPSNGTTPDLSNATVADIAIESSHPNEVLAAVDGLGVVLSPDEGAHWTRLTEEFTPSGSQVVRIFRRGNMILYATNSGSMNRSLDGGQSWSPTRIAHAGDATYSVELSPWSPDVIAAGTSTGPVLSTDFGSTWSDLSGSLPHVPCAVAFRSDARTNGYFAFGEAIGLQRTSDGGMHWSPADLNLGGSTIRLLATNEDCSLIYAALNGSILTYDPASGAWSRAGIGLEGDTVEALSVAMESPLNAIAGTNLGGYRTSDGGKTWNALSDRLPVVPKALALYPRVKTRVLAAGNQGVFISTDGGTSWIHSFPIADRYDVRSFTFMPTDVSIVYAATGNTASVISRDGGFHWEPSRYGIDTKSINLITLDDQDPSIAYAWTPQGESYRTTNAGMEWNRYAPPWSSTDTVIIAVDRYQPSKAVACTNHHLLYYTANGGGTWFPFGAHDLPGTVTALLWNENAGIVYAAVRHKGLFMLSLRALIASLTAG